MKLVTVQDLVSIVRTHGFEKFLDDVVKYLKSDFLRWNEFDKSSRYAAHVPDGVIELMPIADGKYFSYKYVTGHPNNPLENKQTIVALGQLSEIKYGFPLLISEMTTLTAFRTAATTMIATECLARRNSHTLALIGTGAQSEFQALAHRMVRPIKTIRYFDVDSNAMRKFETNLAGKGFHLVPCKSAKEACDGADIITVCTACKNHVVVVENSWVKEGTHINGLGGDCPGKTELEKSILLRSKVFVEFKEQSLIEGEIQQLSPEEVNQVVHGELWELLNGTKAGRERDSEITVFDSVGFAIEDFSALRLVYDLALQYKIGEDINMIPSIKDPKNLFSILNFNNKEFFNVKP